MRAHVRVISVLVISGLTAQTLRHVGSVNILVGNKHIASYSTYDLKSVKRELWEEKTTYPVVKRTGRVNQSCVLILRKYRTTSRFPVPRT